MKNTILLIALAVLLTGCFSPTTVPVDPPTMSAEDRGGRDQAVKFTCFNINDSPVTADLLINGFPLRCEDGISPLAYWNGGDYVYVEGTVECDPNCPVSPCDPCNWVPFGGTIHLVDPMIADHGGDHTRRAGMTVKYGKITFLREGEEL